MCKNVVWYFSLNDNQGILNLESITHWTFKKKTSSNLLGGFHCLCRLAGNPTLGRLQIPLLLLSIIVAKQSRWPSVLNLTCTNLIKAATLLPTIRVKPHHREKHLAITGPCDRTISCAALSAITILRGAQIQSERQRLELFIP